MDRTELERMDREGLVLRAQAAGIRRARLLTRPELIDELLRLNPVIDETQLKKTRGFFGLARDLLSKVVERGLHLPDAADRLRAALGPEPPQVPRPEPQAVPTVTLAEIYAAQGHKQRAIDTLERVLDAEPDHGAARALLEQLQSSDYVGPAPVLRPETEAEVEVEAVEGPSEQVDEIGAQRGAPVEAEPPPETVATSREGEPDAVAVAVASHVDPIAPAEASPRASSGPLPPPLSAAVEPSECIAVPIGDGRSYVWWRVNEDTSGGTFVVRALVLLPAWGGPEQRTLDVAADPASGEMVLRDLPPHGIVRVAVGWVERGDFTPVAHSPALETTPSRELVHWTPEGVRPALPAFGASIARAVAAAERMTR